MKKTKLIAGLALAAITAGTLVAFTACGEPQVVEKEVEKIVEVVKAPTLSKTYCYGYTAKNARNFDVFYVYDLVLYDNNTYAMTITEDTYGYSMCLGTTVTYYTGESAMGKSEDGYTAINLKDADYICYSSYSKMGGYSKQFTLADFPNEDSTVLFPDDVVTTKAEFKALGAASTVYVEEGSCAMSLVDPNA